MKLFDYNVPRPLAYFGLLSAVVLAANFQNLRHRLSPEDFSEVRTDQVGLIAFAGLILLETPAVIEGVSRYQKALDDNKRSKERQAAYWLKQEEDLRNFKHPDLDESDLKQFTDHLDKALGSKSEYEKEYDRVTRCFHGLTQPLKPETLEALRVLGYPSDFEDLPKNTQKEAKPDPSEKTTKPTKTETARDFSRLVPLELSELSGGSGEAESDTEQEFSPSYTQELQVTPKLTLVTSEKLNPKPAFGGFESRHEAQTRYLRELPKPLSHFALNALARLKRGKSTSTILREDLRRPGSAKCYEGDYLNDGKRIWEDLGLPIVVKGTEPYKPCDRSRKVRVHLEVPEKFKDSVMPARVQSSEDYLKTLEAV